MFRNVNQLIVIGAIAIDGQDYQVVLVKLVNNCPDSDWIAYVRRHLRSLGLVPAKGDAVKAVAEQFYRHKIMQEVVSMVAAVGEFSRNDNGYKVYPVAIKNLNFRGQWHPDQWRIRPQHREPFHYLGLRKVEE